MGLVRVLLLVIIKLLFRRRLLLPLRRCLSLRACLHHVAHLLLRQSVWGMLGSFLWAGVAKSCEHFLLKAILLGHNFTEGSRSWSDRWNWLSCCCWFAVAWRETLLLVIDSAVSPVSVSWGMCLAFTRFRRAECTRQGWLVPIAAHAKYLVSWILEQSRLPALHLWVIIWYLIRSNREPIAPLVLVWSDLAVCYRCFFRWIKWISSFVGCFLNCNSFVHSFHRLVVLAWWFQGTFWASPFVCELAFHACCFYFDLSNSLWLVGAILVCILALLTWWWERSATRLSTVLWWSLSGRREIRVLLVIKVFVIADMVLVLLAVRVLCLMVSRALLFSVWTLLIKVVCFCQEKSAVALWATIYLLFARLDGELLRRAV